MTDNFREVVDIAPFDLLHVGHPLMPSLCLCGRSTSVDGRPVCNVIRCAQSLRYTSFTRGWWRDSRTSWSLDPPSPPKAMSFRPQQTPVAAVPSTACCGSVLKDDTNPWHPCYELDAVSVPDRRCRRRVAARHNASISGLVNALTVGTNLH